MVDAAIVSGLLRNLTPPIREDVWLFWSCRKDVEKLLSKLSLLRVFLEDAERRRIKLEGDKQTEEWLRKLKDLAYEVRDIMDEYTFEDLRLQVKRLNNVSSSTRIQVTNCIAHRFSITWTHQKIGQRIKGILKKLDQISCQPKNLHLRETIYDTRPTGLRETMSMLSEKIYGRDNEKEKIVDIIVHATEKLSVLPILGLGGLGKTTLAQMVFNDEEITKYFDVKIWVFVSEIFDIKLVIKTIIGATNENSLETLRNEIQYKLRGKKYLIVLDDVWNENIDEWIMLKSILNCGSNGSFILATTRKRNVAEIMKTNQYFKLSPLSEDDCWQLFEERAFMYGIPKTTNFIGIGKEIAKMCKGVPLAAKTLGAQLGFKNDVKEWYTIRDSEMWKISENEEYDILSILRLSYYDLPYFLRRCFAFCAIFPKDTVIEKEKLIQLWMAHGLILTNGNQQVEDDGNKIWDELCWRSFFQDEKEEISVYINEVQRTCKMSGVMYDLAQSVMKDECYRMDANSSFEDFRRDIRRHVMVTAAEYTIISTDSLKKIGGLQSIILNFHDYLPYSKETSSVLKELSSLRVLEISRRILKSQDLRYVGRLKHLRYLNLSFCKVKTLHNSICDLLNLQTLNLHHSYNLESLPRNMKNLINLQHLHLNGCDGLKYMPRGIRQLRHLKTLSMFVIGKESDCQFDELQELDIGGHMEIKNLETVSDASVERGGISMSKKSSINQLKLHWNVSRPFHDDIRTMTRDEKICEALEVSSTCLKILRMEGYKGVNIPKWMGESSDSLRMIHLSDLENVNHVFTMSNMNGMVVMLFPLLEELEIRDMKNLRELVSPPIPTTEAFHNLRKIHIHKCPQLGALPPNLKSLKDVTVWGECSDELFDSISDLSGLTRLSLTNVNERSILFSTADMNGKLFPFLEELIIEDMKNLREFVSSPIPITTTTIGVFPNLCNIVINKCPNLGVLPQHLKSLKDITVKGQCSDELLYSISNLSGLAHLTLMFMEERSVLFGGSASIFQSLRHLEIHFCYKLSCLFDEKLDSGCLSNLNSLTIIGCRNLIISLEQLRNLANSHSLQSLEITNCPKFVPSKVEEIALISSLREKLGSKNFREDIRQGRRCRNCTPTIPLKKDLVEILNEEDIGEEQSTMVI